MSSFEEIVSGIEIDVDSIEDVIDMTQLSLEELLDLAVSTQENLLDNHQAIFPKEQWARDMHSLRYAARLELIRRQQESE